MDMALTLSDLSDLESILSPEKTQELLQASDELKNPIDRARKQLEKSDATIEQAASVMARVMTNPSEKGSIRLRAAEQIMRIHGVVTEEDKGTQVANFNTIIIHGDQAKAMAVLNPRRDI